MAKFRKKPVEVEAEQFFPDKPLPFRDRGPVVCFNDGRWYVTTMHEEVAHLAPGDWVILESVGQFRAYPCKPEVFEANYEPVPAEPKEGHCGLCGLPMLPGETMFKFHGYSESCGDAKVRLDREQN